LAGRGYRLIKEIPRLDCFYIHEEFVEQYVYNLRAFSEGMWDRSGPGST
jgi:DNA integrity scanning protein DisA with diadenylate cyclase activity